MAVYARCAVCRADNQHGMEACRKCGTALEGCKYIVQVPQDGRNVRRSFSALVDAFRAEAELLKAAPRAVRGRPKRDAPARAGALQQVPAPAPPQAPAGPVQVELLPPQGQAGAAPGQPYTLALAFNFAQPQQQQQPKEPAPNPTMRQVWERYARHILPTLKRPRFNEGLWRVHVAPAFAGRTLGSIKAAHIEDFLADMYAKRVPLAHNARVKRTKPLALQSIIHAVKLIRRLFNYAVQSDMWEGKNPVRKVELPKFNNEVVRALTREQSQRLLHVLDTWRNRPVALALKMCLLTGKRAGEVFNLEWEQVDLHRGFIRFNIKSLVRGEGQSLPITQGVRDILEAAQWLQYPGATRVFTTRSGRRIHYLEAWRRIKRRAGLPADFRVHDLRHAFASELVSNGCDLFTVQKLLGHKSSAMTQRYAHLADEALRRGLAQAEALFMGRVGVMVKGEKSHP